MITFPLVSVVLCSYNGEKYLEEQLTSILAQTYPSLEIIICDDCSVDLTQSIIKTYAFKDRRIQYFFNKENIGVNKNFEQGFLKATGVFIVIADQDDIWKPEKIQKQFDLFSADDIILVHTTSAIFSGNELPLHKILKKTELPMQGNDSRKLMLRNSISGHNIMFRKKLFNIATPFPSNVYYDWWLCEVATCCGQINSSNEILAFQRRHADNVTIVITAKGQTKKVVKERVTALQAFAKIPYLKSADKSFCEKLLGYYSELEHKKRSFKLFIFLLRNSQTLFFYKKKKIPYVSYIKTAYRLSGVAD